MSIFKKDNTKKLEPIKEETKDIKYQSSELLLSVIQKEYDNEQERSKSLESRAGMFITFVGALLALMPTIAKIPNINKVKVKNIIDALPFNLVIIITILTFSSLIISLISFIRVISVKKYKTITIADFNESNALYKNDEVAMALVNEYRKVIQHNTDVNDNKVSSFRIGIYCILISLILISIIYVFSAFIIN